MRVHCGLSGRAVAYVLVALLAAWVPGARAQISVISYQGTLEENGSPVTGTRWVRFQLWTGSTAGVQVGSDIDVTNLAVNDGVFTTSLDFGADVFSGADRWLQIQVVSNGGSTVTTLMPRQRILVAPYAILAAQIGNNALNGYSGVVTFANDVWCLQRLKIGTVEYIEDGGTNILSCRASLAPTTDSAYTLGKLDFRWGTVYAQNGVIQTSDARDKQDILDLDYGLDTVLQLRPVSFDWREHPEQGRQLGLVAQDVAQVIPEIVQTTDTVRSEDPSVPDRVVPAEHMGMSYTALVPVLIRAVQQQQEQIDALQAQVDELKARLDAGGR
ncbi:MAG: tail fiber domain-containing protein [Phycisphaerales bacterium]